jgi:hypothetical protein
MFLGGAIGPPQELLRYIYDNSWYPATPLQAITPYQLSIFLVCHVFNNLYIMLYTNEERHVRSTNNVVFIFRRTVLNMPNDSCRTFIFYFEDQKGTIQYLAC